MFDPDADTEEEEVWPCTFETIVGLALAAEDEAILLEPDDSFSVKPACWASSGSSISELSSPLCADLSLSITALRELFLFFIACCSKSIPAVEAAATDELLDMSVGANKLLSV